MCETCTPGERGRNCDDDDNNDDGGDDDVEVFDVDARAS